MSRASEIQQFLDAAVQEGVFPGTAVAVGTSTGLDVFTAGKLSNDAAIAKDAVSESTVYDVASLTKIMVTGVLAAAAVAENRLALDEKAATYLPELQYPFTIRQLLCHSSGFVGWQPVYERLNPKPLSRQESAQKLFSVLNAMDFINDAYKGPPGVRAEYSDLGFMVLGLVLERVFQQDLQTLAQKRVFDVLKMSSTRFGDARDLLHVAPTENCPVRGRVIRGEVHDLNAWALGGVAGHAGVFSTVTDVGRFAQAVLKNLKTQEILVRPPVLRQFAERQNIPAGSSWALAFDTPSPMHSTSGSYWKGIGHLGYTGCSLWLDPGRDFFIACLSNRVHPSSDNKKIQSFRPALHDLIVETYFPEVKAKHYSKAARLAPNAATVAKVQRVHMIAACGTGMGSLAGLMKAKGFTVSGSDQNVYPPMSTQLEKMGISLLNGYECGRLEGVDLVIVGNAVSRGNPELEEAFDKSLPVVSMPEALELFILKDAKTILVSGTHGKTTTSSLASWILHRLNLHGGFFVGGVLANFNQSWQLPGKSGAPFVVEGDEYDSACYDKRPKFLHFNPDVTILTSVEYDHADIYPSFEAVKTAFAALTNKLGKNSLLIANAQDPVVAQLAAATLAQKILYGLDDNRLDISALAIEEGPNGIDFDLYWKGERQARLHSPLVGRHNLANLLAVLAILPRYGVSFSDGASALQDFQGVLRRQQIRGEVKGVRVIDDFAHHPTAVRVTLEALRRAHPQGRFWVLFEPRTASSRRKVFQADYAKSFDLADEVVIAAVFKADGIAEAERFSSEDLVADLKERGKSAVFMPDVDAIVRHVVPRVKSGDSLVVLSNGGFGGIHDKLLAALKNSA